MAASSPTGAPARRIVAGGATLAQERASEGTLPVDHMAARTVVAERDGPVVTLLLNEPERRNPLSLATMDALRRALDEAGADPGVRAVVIGAAGPVFSAGHDLRE